MTPIQRTQKLLKEQGYIVANCERKMPCTPAGFKGRLITQDLFGFIDTLAIKNVPHYLPDLLAVQTTSGAHHADHIAKIHAAPAFFMLRRVMRIEIWSWAKRGARGKRKVWTLRKEQL